MADDLDDDFDSIDSTDAADDNSSSSDDSSNSGIAIDYSLASKDKEREELDRQIAEFLARGGKISQVDTHVCADPPQKPSSSYGSRPI
ncbi:hypothetical protein [Halioxenophilus aromaticivorans]|uniref:Transcriptional regulator SutA RNAP-binding domain-containing protein n=1 Tax=Halioxenophilus aromaticivorans TaxID=1306992 RepID=A0AAV3U5B3_9ALTE